MCPRHCDIKTLLNCQFYLYNISNFQRTTKLGSFWWDIQNYFFGNERSTCYRFKYWEVIASTLYSIPIDYKWFIWLYDLFIFQGFYFDFFCRYQSIYSHPCELFINFSFSWYIIKIDRGSEPSAPFLWQTPSFRFFCVDNSPYTADV